MHEEPRSKEVYHGAFINVRVQTLDSPHGGVDQFEIVEHPDAVAIVAVHTPPGAAPEVALVLQDRPAIGRQTWEIPAGLITGAEMDDPTMAAARELREETGATANQWDLLTREYPSPGFSTEAISIYLATDVQRLPNDHPLDATEIAGLDWVPLDAALARCASGEIQDGKTVLGLTLTREALLGTRGEDAMPHDVTNMPMRRDAPFRQDAAGAPGLGTLDAGLKLDNMLLEEYNYAGVTAYQAMEDRARMFNLYLLLIGVVGSAVGAIYQIGGRGGSTRALVQPVVILLLLVAGVLGFAFFAKVIRLRQAFRQSLISMGRIREFYIEKFKAQVPDVEHAFLWRLRTIPAGERLGSVTFLVCYTIAFLGSLCLAGATYLVYEDWFAGNIGTVLPLPDAAKPWILAAAVFFIALALHILFYVRALNKKDEAKALDKAADDFNQQTQ